MKMPEPKRKIIIFGTMHSCTALSVSVDDPTDAYPVDPKDVGFFQIDPYDLPKEEDIHENI